MNRQKRICKLISGAYQALMDAADLKRDHDALSDLQMTILHCRKSLQLTAMPTKTGCPISRNGKHAFRSHVHRYPITGRCYRISSCVRCGIDDRATYQTWDEEVTA